MNQNGRKNYNEILKSIQARKINAEFIVDDFNKILAGDDMANISVAYVFRCILTEGDDMNLDAPSEIFTRFKKLRKNRTCKKQNRNEIKKKSLKTLSN